MTALDMLALLLAAIAAALLSAGVVWSTRPLLQRYALARPNARSSHSIPTPQGAGIAVLAATLLVAALCARIIGATVAPTVVIASLFIAVVGFADDLMSIPVLPRFLLQAVAVGAVVFSAPADLRMAPVLPLALERGLLLLAGLWFVNLVNFMDGLDLMTVAEVVPITAAMVLLGWLGAATAPVSILAAALCGAMLGFAPFNRPVAKVFLGDVGSLPIGLLLGWCLLQLVWQDHLVAALLLPLYYLTDATLTLFRRVAKREPFWAAHRTHFYQRATVNGFSVAQVVGEVFLLNIVLAVLAIASIDADAVLAVMALLAGACAVMLVLYRFSRKRPG